MDRERLEQRIRTGIPISAQMDFHVLELGATRICVSGGGHENVNVHGTAFAGSLYAICTLAAWGLTHSRLPASAALVLAEGNIRYLRPVSGAIVARCECTEQAIDVFLNTLQRDGRARIDLQVTVDAGGKQAVLYTCQLHARLPG